jgi:membrane associated rhomboid family serine protease
MKEFFSEINRMLDRFLTPAVKTILVVNVAVSFALTLLSVNRSISGELLFRLGQVPALSIYKFHVWQFGAYIFIHADFMHLLFNMVCLWFFAPPLEERWGSRRFWQFYLIVGAGAGLFHALLTIAHYTLAPSPSTTLSMLTPVVGASGALYGVFIAYAAYFPDRPVYIWGVFPLKAKHLLFLMIFANFMLSASANRDGVSYLTHLTGLVVAYVWLALYHRDKDIRRWRWTRGF